jgi:hypothetical protein
MADAVLLEGYVLYPYRADSTKNRYRWTFGVLAPQAWSEAGGCEPWWLEAQVIVEGADPEIHGRLRFLRIVERRVEAKRGIEHGYQRVERLDVNGKTFVDWEEGESVEVDFTAAADGSARSTPIAFDATEEVDVLRDRRGMEVGRVIRTRAALRGTIRTTVERLRSTAAPLARVIVRVENGTPFPNPSASRVAAVRAAFVSTHLLLGVDAPTRFRSLIDPPDHATAAAASCTNVGTHPVLAGEPAHDDVVLAAPIILYDHPAIAPESTGDFFDAGEIDELLALRTRALGVDERTLARATDPRAAELLDRALALTDSELARLHGARIDAAGERTPLTGGPFRPGARVKLQPNPRRRTDAQDLLYRGRFATIEAIRHDVDGRDFLAVTLDDDPAVEMHRAKGRFHYYYADEVEPLGRDDE